MRSELGLSGALRMRPTGHFTALMSPAAGLRPTAPPLLRSAKRPAVLIREAVACLSLAELLRATRASGGRRSEVKEEGWAQPGPGDMSGGDHPMASPPRAAQEHMQ